MMKKNNYTKQEPTSIQALFGSIAKDYDRTNTILSLGLNHLWNRTLIKHISKSKPMTLLDLCSGTGEIALGWLKRQTNPKKVFLLDFCKEMLQCAEIKGRQLNTLPHEITYVQADAEQLPLLSESVECVSVAYGIRNIRKLDNCFEEVLRVLKPGGRFCILELTEPDFKALNFLHRFYLKSFLPLVGGRLTKNQRAYEYLCQSIQEFIKPKEIKALLKQKGFGNITVQPLHGGIASLIHAEKI